MNATRQEVYVSVDIAADGPIPGPHSMLRLASAAFLPDKTRVSTFSVNLETLPGAGADPRTMEWREQFPEAWQASRSDPQPPATAMRAYVDWLGTLPGTPQFEGWPAAWDIMRVYWYLIRYTEQRPFGESAIDSRSYAK